MILNKADTDDKSEIFVTAVVQLSMARTIDEVGDIVRAAARKLSGADGATFILRENNLCYYANEDAISPLWKGKRFPMEACISGWVMLNKAQAVIPDIYQDNRIPHEAYRPTFVKSLAMVPIRKDNPLGAIGNYWSSNTIADTETLKVLQALADITAVSIENIYVYNELEKRVQDRTRQLEQSNEQLKKVNAELETITYALSHDLKAPLRSIGFNLERMIADIGEHFSAKAKEHRDRVLSKVANAQLLIDELLTLFKTSNKDLVIERVDMKDLAERSWFDFKDLLHGDITVEVHHLPSIRGDKVLLRHVWSNLISNAIKYSVKRESPKISIGAEILSNSVVYCVEDNGIGFDIDKARNLFKPFTRFHASDEYEGAGIGLSIVERIVSRHGGRVWAKSAVDTGTTVFFELPK